MAAQQLTVVALLALGGALVAFVMWRSVVRTRRRLAAGTAAASAPGPSPATGAASGPSATQSLGDPLVRRLEQRLEGVEAAQAALGERMTSQNGEARLKEMAGSLVGLIRDKNATLETALAGLDQLRARMRTLEQIGDAAEARGLFERLGTRIDEIQAAHAATGARIDARIEVLQRAGENPFAEVSERLGQLYSQKDAAVETVLARLAPLEARMTELQGALGGVEAARAQFRELAPRIEALQRGQAETEARLSALQARAEAEPHAEIAGQLSKLYAQKDAMVETVFARLTPLEAQLGQLRQDLDKRDPAATLDRFAERLEAAQRAHAASEADLRRRIADLEAPKENPFAEISEQLTRLYAQKDATVETVFARIAPLEAKLAELEGTLGQIDPKAALDRFAERLEAVQGRVTELEEPRENPFAEISEQLTRLYAQKDATVETVFARLAPLEAKLADVEGTLGRIDPKAALDRFAERLEAVQGRVTELETLPKENPFAEISDQLARLYAQKDATVETVFARLTPMEAKLAGLEGALGQIDPKAALDRFAERLEAVQGRVTELEEPRENPFAEISEQLTRLYAQKDATVETVFARLAPLEAKLADVEGTLGRIDPKAALDRFAERLEAVQNSHAATEADLRGRIAELAAPRENPYAEISEQLTRLYSQKDATVETVFARLAPLEAKLAGLETATGRIDALEAGVDGQTPRAAFDELGARLAGMQAAQGEIAACVAALQAAAEAGSGPLAEISEQIAQLNVRKDALLEEVLTRLTPIEARLATLEVTSNDSSAAEEARAEARAIAAQMIALRAAAAQTELFADRLALLEASLPRLSAAQSLMMHALESQTSGRASADAVPEEAGRTGGEEAAPPVRAEAAADAGTIGEGAMPAAAASAQPARKPAAEDDLRAILDLPRQIVSLHRK